MSKLIDGYKLTKGKIVLFLVTLLLGVYNYIVYDEIVYNTVNLKSFFYVISSMYVCLYAIVVIATYVMSNWDKPIKKN